MNFEHDDQNCPVVADAKHHAKLSSKNWSHTKTHNETAKNSHHHNYHDEHYDAQDDYYGNDDDYFYHYYDNNDEAEAYTEPKAKPSQHRAGAFDPFEFWTTNPTSAAAASSYEPAASHQAKTVKAKHQPQKETKPAKPSQKSPQATKPSTGASTNKTASQYQQQQQHQQPQKQASKPTVSCYKKFAVGNYAHLLNEEPAADYSTQPKKQSTNKPKNNKEVSAEEVRADHYQYNNGNKKSSYDNDENPDFERIASNVNSHGRQKWKNSTKQTQQSKFNSIYKSLFVRIIINYYFIFSSLRRT